MQHPLPNLLALALLPVALLALTPLGCGDTTVAPMLAPEGDRNGKADDGDSSDTDDGDSLEADATLSVTLHVTGAGIDPNGVLLQIDDLTPVRLADTITLPIASGTRALHFLDIRSNCHVIGESTREVVIPANGQAQIALDLECDAPADCVLDGLTSEGPLAEGLLASVGVVRAAMIFVDFPDAPATDSIDSVHGRLAPYMTRWFDEVSGGALELELVAGNAAWLRMSRDSTEYGAGTFTEHRDYIAEAAALAAAEIDFSAFDTIYVVPSRDVEHRAAAWRSNPGSGVMIDGHELRIATTLSEATYSDLHDHGARVAVHETGHMLGLPDLYPYATSGHAFAGIWDIMGWAGEGTRFLAYHRLRLGWIGDKEIDCVEPEVGRAPVEQVLNALGAPGAVEAMVVRTSPTTALVAEMRAAEGLDDALCKEGILIYRVDANIMSGEGPIRVVLAEVDEGTKGNTGQCGPLYNAPFDEDTPIYTDFPSGVTFTLSRPLEGGYLVRATFEAPQPDRCNLDIDCEEETQLCARDTATCLEHPLQGFFKLKSDEGGPDQCLESNHAASSHHSGAAYMDACEAVTGQSWEFLPDGEHFRIRSRFQGPDMCLESNSPTERAHSGAAFMDECKNVSGQLWEVIFEEDHVLLKSLFQGEGRCLESNDPESAAHDGAAFMNTCRDAPGQRWELVPR